MYIWKGFVGVVKPKLDRYKYIHTSLAAQSRAELCVGRISLSPDFQGFGR
jgi:hypothetical protein